eukprot:5683005-Amphidinium_carterae.1
METSALEEQQLPGEDCDEHPVADEPVALEPPEHEEGAYWDDVHGGWLPREAVEEARAHELDWVHRQKVYHKVPRSEVRGRLLDLKWVDTDKGAGAAGKLFVRSRLVVRDIKARKTSAEQLAGHQLFSATPPLEAVRLLASLLVSKRKSKAGLPLKLT